MRPLVIYHANCADGFAAAFAAWLKIGDEAEYVPCQYGQITGDEEGWEKLMAKFADGGNLNRDVYILDFSFPRTIMDHLMECADKVVWLDHHASSRVMAEEFCNAKD